MNTKSTLYPRVQDPPDDTDLTGVDGGFEPIPVEQSFKKAEKQISDFTELLDSISSIEEKTKSLWRQIYENAVQDRRNAYLMWSDLYMHVRCNPNEHAIHGQNLARYMERMSKANDQILKLAEMVAKESEDQITETVTKEDIYEQILKQNQKSH